MEDLRKRFGRLLAFHRRRLSYTQETLAEAAGLSVDMISKLEVGATGARFPAIERLAGALEIDPAELFTNDLPGGAISQGTYGEISAVLTRLGEDELAWVKTILDAALSGRESKKLAIAKHSLTSNRANTAIKKPKKRS